MKKLILSILIISLVPLGLSALDMLKHKIEKGETLYSLSRSYHVSVSAIQEVNNIEDPHSIKVGQIILVPGLYTVKAGDTFYGIAKKHKVSVESLLEVNDRSKDSILKVGERLAIPGIGGASSEEDEMRPAVRQNGKNMLVSAESFSSSDHTWPHPGNRKKMDGKLPGIVISGEEGDPVFSVASGTVFWSGRYGSYGKVVFVRSDSGYIYMYGGNEATDVQVGDRVTPGTVIGKMGVDALLQVPQLYFGVYKNGRYVNPEEAPRI